MKIYGFFNERFGSLSAVFCDSDDSQVKAHVSATISDPRNGGIGLDPNMCLVCLGDWDSDRRMIRHTKHVVVAKFTDLFDARKAETLGFLYGQPKKRPGEELKVKISEEDSDVPEDEPGEDCSPASEVIGSEE